MLMGPSAWLAPAIPVAAAAPLLRCMSRLKDRHGARVDETNGLIVRTRSRSQAEERGQAKPKGLLEGLREATASRCPAS